MKSMSALMFVNMVCYHMVVSYLFPYIHYDTKIDEYKI